MRKIIRNSEPYNLPLWQAARERRYNALPYAAQRLARERGLEPETANLLAELAGLKGGR